MNLKFALLLSTTMVGPALADGAPSSQTLGGGTPQAAGMTMPTMPQMGAAQLGSSPAGGGGPFVYNLNSSSDGSNGPPSQQVTVDQTTPGSPGDSGVGGQPQLGPTINNSSSGVSSGAPQSAEGSAGLATTSGGKPVSGQVGSVVSPGGASFDADVAALNKAADEAVAAAAKFTNAASIIEAALHGEGSPGSSSGGGLQAAPENGDQTTQQAGGQGSAADGQNTNLATQGGDASGQQGSSQQAQSGGDSSPSGGQGTSIQASNNNQAGKDGSGGGSPEAAAFNKATGDVSTAVGQFSNSTKQVESAVGSIEAAVRDKQKGQDGGNGGQPSGAQLTAATGQVEVAAQKFALSSKEIDTALSGIEKAINPTSQMPIAPAPAVQTPTSSQVISSTSK